MKSIVHVMVLGAALTWLAWHFSPGPWTPTRVAGLVLSVPAFVLWAVARIQLGTSFAVRAKAKELVTGGLYSKIRNPVYVFGTIFVAGYFLLMGKPLGLLLPAAVVPVQIFRARKEAKVLEEKFGDAYREYRRKTWF
jgi:protein-S-isoprenylcysteine O-methyltransferase Ste14